MSEYELDERGWFWFACDEVPADFYAPEGATAGRLTVDAAGKVALQLDGRLNRSRKLKTAFRRGATDFERSVAIQGFLTSRTDHALLLGAYENGVEYRSNGPATERFVALACLVGSDPFTPRDIAPKYTRIKFGLRGYGRWLASDGTDVKNTRRSTRYIYERPAARKYPMPWGNLELTYGLSYKLTRIEDGAGFSAVERATFVNTFQRGISLRETLEQIGYLRDLLILLTNVEHQPDWARVRIGRRDCDYTLYHGRSEPKKVERTYNPWTRYPELADDFGKILQAWASASQRFGPGVYLYVGTRRGMDMYAEHRLINLIWGLETFHRRKFGDGKPSAKLQKRLDRIYGAIEGKTDLKWLRRSLRNAAEPALDQRLFSLFSTLPIKVDQKDLRAFCERCAKFRNDMSHHGGMRDGDDPSNRLTEWSQHADAASLLYHLVLLAEIGIPADVLSRIAGGTHKWAFDFHFGAAGLVPRTWLPKSPAD